MKRTLLLLIASALLALTAHAATIKLAWDPSASDPTNGSVGYKVYYGAASATYTNTVNAGTNLTASVTNLSKGQTYYFAATAYLTNGLESDYSQEISWSMPTNPPAPLNLHVTVAVVVDVNVNAIVPKK